LEKVQRRFTRTITGLKGKNYYERLRHVNLWTMNERRNRQDLMEVFKIYKRFTKMDISELYTITKDSNHSAQMSKYLGATY